MRGQYISGVTNLSSFEDITQCFLPSVAQRKINVAALASAFLAIFEQCSTV